MKPLSQEGGLDSQSPPQAPRGCVPCSGPRPVTQGSRHPPLGRHGSAPPWIPLVTPRRSGPHRARGPAARWLHQGRHAVVSRGRSPVPRAWFSRRFQCFLVSGRDRPPLFSQASPPPVPALTGGYVTCSPVSPRHTGSQALTATWAVTVLLQLILCGFLSIAATQPSCAQCLVVTVTCPRRSVHLWSRCGRDFWEGRDVGAGSHISDGGAGPGRLSSGAQALGSSGLRCADVVDKCLSRAGRTRELRFLLFSDPGLSRADARLVQLHL